jgi:hypothetical protein
MGEPLRLWVRRWMASVLVKENLATTRILAARGAKVGLGARRADILPAAEDEIAGKVTRPNSPR